MAKRTKNTEVPAEVIEEATKIENVEEAIKEENVIDQPEEDKDTTVPVTDEMEEIILDNEKIANDFKDASDVIAEAIANNPEKAQETILDEIAKVDNVIEHVEENLKAAEKAAKKMFDRRNFTDFWNGMSF